MPSYRVHLEKPRPYFAEIPYYVWGTVNYDSEGDCKRPTDREWSWVYFCHRETDETLTIRRLDGGEWVVEGADPLAARASYFLMNQCGATAMGETPEERMGEWDHTRAAARAARVKSEFERPELRPFDSGHLFWGSWKWIGWFGTEFTWVGRWIMSSVLANDRRAVELCIYWLRDGTVDTAQSEALRYALNRFTGLSFGSDQEWVHWYDREGKEQYPKPDFDKWCEDLKEQYGSI